MTAIGANKFPINMSGGTKHDLRTQFAALPWRFRKNKLEVCIITSRTSKRWIVPKGWPMDGRTPTQAAEIEAWEEAGLKGKMSDTCIGVYSYVKPLDKTRTPCLAMIFPMKVRTEFDHWPERHQRRRKWVSRKKAAQLLHDDELAQIVRRFDPRKW